MSKITRSILSILQENAGNYDITTMDGINAVATQVLFPQDGLSLIDDEYQDRLVVGFTTHYLTDEIVFDTLPLWKIKLLEKLVNNYDYINEIYANLDKQIFADYQVRNVESSGDNNETKNTIGSTDVSKNVLSSDEGSNNRTYGEGIISNREIGEDGTENATFKKEGAETRKRTGNDYIKKEGSELQERGGDDTTTDNGYNDNRNSKGTSTYNNGVNITFDTPVDKLDGLRTGGNLSDIIVTNDPQDGEIGGDEPVLRELNIYGLDPNGNSAGWDYMEGQTYDYLSAASEQDSTQLNVENGNDQSVNYNQSKTEFGGKTATTYGKNIDGQSVDRKDTTYYNSNDITIYGINGDASAERKDITLRGTTKDVTEDLSESKTGSDNTSITNSHTMSEANVTSVSNTDATNGSHSDQTDEVNYHINSELVLRSECYLTRLWAIFDDLFINFSY